MSFTIFIFFLVKLYVDIVNLTLYPLDLERERVLERRLRERDLLLEPIST